LPSCLVRLSRLPALDEAAIIISAQNLSHSASFHSMENTTPSNAGTKHHAVWIYHRFALSTADVEDLLAERGIMVSRETVRLWVNRFGSHFADCIRRDRPRPNDKWHLDEVVIVINGTHHWL
jgi:transposase-like protein